MSIPPTMSAVQLMGHGGLDQLHYSEDVPTPHPAAGEVLIDVHACGMNNTDVWVREGAYGSDTDPGEVSTWRDRKSTRLNSSHVAISYAVFCLKKKKCKGTVQQDDRATVRLAAARRTDA